MDLGSSEQLVIFGCNVLRGFILRFIVEKVFLCTTPPKREVLDLTVLECKKHLEVFFLFILYIYIYHFVFIIVYIT